MFWKKRLIVIYMRLWMDCEFLIIIITIILEWMKSHFKKSLQKVMMIGRCFIFFVPLLNSSAKILIGTNSRIKRRHVIVLTDYFCRNLLVFAALIFL